MNNKTSNYPSKHQPGDDSRRNASAKDPAFVEVLESKISSSSLEFLRYDATEYRSPSTALFNDTTAADADARKGSKTMHIPTNRSSVNSKPGHTLNLASCDSASGFAFIGGDGENSGSDYISPLSLTTSMLAGGNSINIRNIEVEEESCERCNHKEDETMVMSCSNEIFDDYNILSLLNLIKVQDWTMFQSIALSSSSFFKALAAAIANRQIFNGMTLLHAVVRYNAPLTLVTKMMDNCPEMTTARDCLGRTALHVAAGCRASPAVIKAVAQVNPAACDATDQDGNTPLHFACDSSCVLFEDDRNRNRSPQEKPPPPPDDDAIAALLSESIHAATIECHEEINPVEHAILSGASIKSVKLLQSSASKYLELQKKKKKRHSCVKRPFVTVNLIRDQVRSQRRRILELESMWE